MPYFHYENLDEIASISRILTSKGNRILALLATQINGNIMWYTTSALVKGLGNWRAAINKYLQLFHEQNWVEQITLENVPGIIEEGSVTRKRKLWRLSDKELGFEYLYNKSLKEEMFDLGSYALSEDGVLHDIRLRYENHQIENALLEMGSVSVLNFLTNFEGKELYYPEAVVKLRSEGISCPKHEKLAKFCDVEFTRIGIDLERFRILDRVYSPDKSTGAPGFTYHLHYPGIRFQLRSMITDLNATVHTPRPIDWNNSYATASQISNLRDGIVVDINQVEN